MLFLYFFALITEEGFLISPCYSLELCIQMGICFLFSFAFRFSSFLSYLLLFFSQLFVRPHQKTILYFCIFFPLGMILITAPCTISQTSVHSSSGTLSGLIPWIYLSLPLYNRNRSPHPILPPSWFRIRLALTDSTFVGLLLTGPSRKSTCKQALQKWCLPDSWERNHPSYSLYDNFLIISLSGSVSIKLSSQESSTDK